MTKQQLQGVRELHKTICDLETYSQYLRRQLTDITAKLDGMPRSAPLEARIERITTAILDAERALESCRQQFLIKQAELSLTIGNHVIKPLVRDILCMRYVDCRSFNDICRHLKLSRATMFRLHNEGISKMRLA